MCGAVCFWRTYSASRCKAVGTEGGKAPPELFFAAVYTHTRCVYHFVESTRITFAPAASDVDAINQERSVARFCRRYSVVLPVHCL